MFGYICPALIFVTDNSILVIAAMDRSYLSLVDTGQHPISKQLFCAPYLKIIASNVATDTMAI